MRFHVHGTGAAWRFLLLGALACQYSLGQPLTVQPHNFTSHRPAPPPTTTAQLTMATLPLQPGPPLVFFNVDTDKRLGPYPLRTNTPIGTPQVGISMRLNANLSELHLQATNPTNALYGPYPTTNNTLISIGRQTLRLLRPPPQLTVSLVHAERINQLPMIGLAPATPQLENELATLFQKFSALEERLAYDSAERVIEGMPRIYRPSGTVFSPVIAPAKRDVAQSIRTADLTAVRYLETLFQQYFSVRSVAAQGAQQYFFSMPPNTYIFCAMQKFRPPTKQGLPQTQTAIWWTTITFDGTTPLQLELTAQNAITWQEIFHLHP